MLLSLWPMCALKQHCSVSAFFVFLRLFYLTVPSSRMMHTWQRRKASHCCDWAIRWRYLGMWSSHDRMGFMPSSFVVSTFPVQVLTCVSIHLHAQRADQQEKNSSYTGMVVKPSTTSKLIQTHCGFLCYPLKCVFRDNKLRAHAHKKIAWVGWPRFAGWVTPLSGQRLAQRETRDDLWSRGLLSLPSSP